MAANSFKSSIYRRCIILCEGGRVTVYLYLVSFKMLERDLERTRRITLKDYSSEVYGSGYDNFLLCLSWCGGLPTVYDNNCKYRIRNSLLCRRRVFANMKMSLHFSFKYLNCLWWCLEIVLVSSVFYSE